MYLLSTAVIWFHANRQTLAASTAIMAQTNSRNTWKSSVFGLLFNVRGTSASAQTGQTKPKRWQPCDHQDHYIWAERTRARATWLPASKSNIHFTYYLRVERRNNNTNVIRKMYIAYWADLKWIFSPCLLCAGVLVGANFPPVHALHTCGEWHSRALCVVFLLRSRTFLRLCPYTYTYAISTDTRCSSSGSPSSSTSQLTGCGCGYGARLITIITSRLSLTWFLFDIENVSICSSSFSYRHSRACANINATNISRNSGFKSMDGAFVNVSYMCFKIPAARRKLSTAMSRPFSVLRSCLVAICVYTPAKLNRMHAFSNATVRWLDGMPAYGVCQTKTQHHTRHKHKPMPWNKERPKLCVHSG